MNDLLTVEQVRALLQEYIDKHGSQKAFAEWAGISTAYVNDVVRGRRGPGPKLLDALNLEWVVGYRYRRQGDDG